MKKQANREVFEGIQEQLKIALNDPDFNEENEADSDFDISIAKLRNKYNNLKRAWQATVDRAKCGSGLHIEKASNLFQILHPVLSDTNSSLDDVSSGPQDTSLLNQVRKIYLISTPKKLSSTHVFGSLYRKIPQKWNLENTR